MKSLAIFALLLLCLCQNGLAVEVEIISETTSGPPTTQLDQNKFSPRLLAVPKNKDDNPIKGFEIPVDLARKLLHDVQLFNLIGEVVQAKHIEASFGKGLLFEMSSALQANQVVKAFVEPPGEFSKRLQVTQDKQDFFD